jgi:lipoprotein-anchoring transpeptidase ErfK/SrfK
VRNVVLLLAAAGLALAFALRDSGDADATWSGSWVATAKGATVPVFPAPDAPAPSVELKSPTKRGAALVLLVDGRDVGGAWLPVHLPVRPNGSKGWVRASDVRLTSNDYKVEVDVSDRRLRLVRQGDVEWETPIGVGTTKHPTPTGDFFLTELIMPKDDDTVYGTFALGLSGFTDSPGAADYKGGEGGLAIHGTNDPDSIGKRISHGCIRVPNDVIDYMASTLPMGTPVEIS